MGFNPSQPRDTSGKWSKPGSRSGSAGRKRGKIKGRYNRMHRHGVLRKKFGGPGYRATKGRKRKR